MEIPEHFKWGLLAGALSSLCLYTAVGGVKTHLSYIKLYISSFLLNKISIKQPNKERPLRKIQIFFLYTRMNHLTPLYNNQPYHQISTVEGHIDHLTRSNPHLYRSMIIQPTNLPNLQQIEQQRRGNDFIYDGEKRDYGARIHTRGMGTLLRQGGEIQDGGVNYSQEQFRNKMTSSNQITPSNGMTPYIHTRQQSHSQLGMTNKMHQRYPTQLYLPNEEKQTWKQQQRLPILISSISSDGISQITYLLLPKIQKNAQVIEIKIPKSSLLLPKSLFQGSKQISPDNNRGMKYQADFKYSTSPMQVEIERKVIEQNHKNHYQNAHFLKVQLFKEIISDRTKGQIQIINLQRHLQYSHISLQQVVMVIGRIIRYGILLQKLNHNILRIIGTLVLHQIVNLHSIRQLMSQFNNNSPLQKASSARTNKKRATRSQDSSCPNLHHPQTPQLLHLLASYRTRHSWIITLLKRGTKCTTSLHLTRFNSLHLNNRHLKLNNKWLSSYNRRKYQSLTCPYNILLKQIISKFYPQIPPVSPPPPHILENILPQKSSIHIPLTSKKTIISKNSLQTPSRFAQQTPKSALITPKNATVSSLGLTTSLSLREANMGGNEETRGEEKIPQNPCYLKNRGQEIDIY